MKKIEFVCSDCATAAGGKIPEKHQPTWHEGKCDVCEKIKVVTQPRDFRHPQFKQR